METYVEDEMDKYIKYYNNWKDENRGQSQSNDNLLIPKEQRRMIFAKGQDEGFYYD